MTPSISIALKEQEPRSLSERAYHKIVRLITRIEFAPGSLIVEKELIARFGIGRTPVREALQRLANEGLIIHEPNRGMFVADITATSAQQIYEFRSLIDGHLVRLASTRATKAQIEQFRALHEEFLRASKAHNIDEYVDLDRRFYALLCDAANNVYLAEVVPRIFHLHLRLWFYIGQQRDEWLGVWQAHVTMIGEVAQAIAARDPDSAESAIKTYIVKRHQDVLDLLLGLTGNQREFAT